MKPSPAVEPAAAPAARAADVARSTRVSLRVDLVDALTGEPVEGSWRAAEFTEVFSDVVAEPAPEPVFTATGQAAVCCERGERLKKYVPRRLAEDRRAWDRATEGEASPGTRPAELLSLMPGTRTLPLRRL